MNYLTTFLFLIPSVLVTQANGQATTRVSRNSTFISGNSTFTSGIGNSTGSFTRTSSTANTTLISGIASSTGSLIRTSSTVNTANSTIVGPKTSSSATSGSISSSNTATGTVSTNSSATGPRTSTTDKTGSIASTNPISTTGTGSSQTGPISSSSSILSTGTRPSTNSSTTELSTSNSATGTGSSSVSSASRPGSGTLPFPTTTSSSSSRTSSFPFSFSGTWSASSTPSPVSLTWFDVPTTTISDAAATSEAVFLGRLFFGLHANRQWITDAKLRSQYIDDVRKTRDETIALFNALNVKPPAPAPCSNTKRKRGALSERQLRALLRDRRSLISGVADLIGDAAKLISCAVNVVNNLVDSVEAPVPPIGVVETLTDTLAEIGKDLEEEDKDDESSSTEQSSSASSSSSTSSSCTGSTAVPVCTQTVSLSTSFMSGGTSSFTVATITKTACSTTTLAGCTGAGTTATTTTSGSGPACTGYNVLNEDDPDEGGEEDPNASKRRSIAGRIKLEPRAGGRTVDRFGSCGIPAGFGNAAITFPGIPGIKLITAADARTKPFPGDQALKDGIARYYDRKVDCDGNTDYQKSDFSKDLKGTDYSMDHAWEVKFLLQFFLTIVPPESSTSPPSSVFKDCNNFNEVFFPSPASSCNNIMQKLYDQVATNRDDKKGAQIEFVAMQRDLNNKKGVIFKPGEFDNPDWRGKNLPTDKLSQWIVTLQQIGIAIAICKDTSVVPLFDKTNLRIYNAFQGIDNLVETKAIALKDTKFKFADAYEAWLKKQLAQQASATWAFIERTMTDYQGLIDKMEDSDTSKATLKKQLENFKNGPYGKESHYSFTFKTALAGGGTAIPFKRSLSERDGTCPIQSGSASATSSGSATVTGSTTATGSTTTTGRITSTGSSTITGSPSTSATTSNSTVSESKTSTTTPTSTNIPVGPRRVCTPHNNGNVPFSRNDGIDAIKTGCTPVRVAEGLFINDFHFSIMRGGVNITGTMGKSKAGIEGPGCDVADTQGMDPKECEDYFMQAIDGCDTDTTSLKYGARPLTLNPPHKGCIDINLFGQQAPISTVSSKTTPPATSTPSPTPPPSTTTPSPPPPTTTAPPSGPDMSSKECQDCGDVLGSSDCSAKDQQCLIDQCKADKSCQACGLDCVKAATS